MHATQPAEKHPISYMYENITQAINALNHQGTWFANTISDYSCITPLLDVLFEAIAQLTAHNQKNLRKDTTIHELISLFEHTPALQRQFAQLSPEKDIQNSLQQTLSAKHTIKDYINTGLPQTI